MPGNAWSSQNNDPDIAAMYKHFVTGGSTPNDNETGENVGIDDVRGQISVSVTGTKTKDLIASLNIDPNSPVAGTPNTTTPVVNAQESRCHAFYRIMGFPVVASETEYYSPGFDIMTGFWNALYNFAMGTPRSLDLGKKIEIANKVSSGFEDISQARETWAANTSKVFNVPQSLEASILALSSGSTDGNKINIRAFDASLKGVKDNPLDYSEADQTYSVESYVSMVGKYKDIPFSSYQDAFGKTPNTSITNPSVLLNHKHIIVPFTVDPRIDFSIGSAISSTITGLSRRIAVPFVTDPSFLQVSSTTRATVPFIETVIRRRLSQGNQVTDSGQATAAMVQYIKDMKSIQDINLGNTTVSNICSGNLFKLSEQNAFADTLSKIYAMMFKLVHCKNDIEEAQGQYYWLPIPSPRGPEGGCGVRGVILNSKLDKRLTTQADFNIVKNQSSAFVSKITYDLSQAKATPDRSGVAPATHVFTFDATTSDSFGDLSAQNTSKQNSDRNAILTRAGEALQIIEMIMGEFSGLGLVDIVAITGAMHVIDIKDLLGLLDIDAYNRAVAILKIPSSLTQTPVVDALTNLTEAVDGFYQIMDAVYQDFLYNNAVGLL